ncbi:MAG: DUF4465 domain-containing protein [Salibacteraceae bacterium]
MIKKLITGLALVGACTSPLLAQSVSGFENIISTKDSTYNGVNQDKGLISGSGHFWNSFNPSWGSWSGFAFSSIKDTTTKGWTNQYASISGSGENNSLSYAVAYNYAKVSFSESINGDSIVGLSISNSTYSYLSMKDGDPYAKKFGGVTGNDSDWYFVEFVGWNKGIKTASVKHYLADFRDSDNSKDFIQKGWKWVNLSSLGRIDELTLSFGSSDVDTTWGFINTPTYACIDSLVYNSSSSLFRPVAENDLFLSNEADTNNEYNILINDKDPDDILLGSNISVISDFSQAASQILGSGLLKLSPNNGAYGWDTLQYELKDKDNLRDSAWVKLLFNEMPLVMNDTFFFNEPSKDTLIDVFVNDIDENISVAQVSILQQPELGSVSVVNNTIKYTTPTQSGTDTIRYALTDEFGLIDSGMVFLNNAFLSSINEMAIQTKVNLYPNPVSDYLFIDSETTFDSFLVFDLNGNTIINESMIYSNKIDLSSLTKGMYFVKLTALNYFITQRIIVK